MSNLRAVQTLAALGIAASLALVGGLLLLTRHMDARQLARDTRLVASQLSFNLESSVQSAANVSRSDQAILHLDHTQDPGWGDQAFQEPASMQIWVYTIAYDDRVVSGLHRGKGDDPATFAFEGELPGWIAALRRQDWRSGPAPGQAVPAVRALRWSGAHLYLLLATPFLPATPTTILRHGVPPMLLVVTPMDAFLRNNLAGTGIDAFGIVRQVPGPDAPGVKLTDAEGHVVGAVTWTPDTPGGALRRALLLPLLSLVGTFAALVWHSYRRGVLAARQILSSEALAQHLALHDDLTRLANRRHFTLELERRVAAAKDAQALAVLMIDLDRFKQVNDTYGHQSGDELLRVVARRLAGQCRPTDFCARLGGDEFVILLSACGMAEVAAFAGRVVAALAEPVELSAATVRIAGSVGISTLGAESVCGSVETLIRQADIALYEVKTRAHGNAAAFFDAGAVPAGAAHATQPGRPEQRPSLRVAAG